MLNRKIIGYFFMAGHSCAAFPPNYYDILNVPKTATNKDIRRAYLNLAKRVHPDKSLDGERFKEINNAYHTLADSRLRREYDRTLTDEDCEFNYACRTDCSWLEHWNLLFFCLLHER